MPKISIIIPVYNVGLYLEKCLTSIVNQSFNDCEVIIVNDGSTDNSETIIHEFTKKYSFITSYYQENQGISAARNFAIKKATGKYLMFIDGDDYIDENLLITLDKETNKKEYDLVKFGYNLVYDDKIISMKDDIVFNKEYVGENFFNSIVLQKRTFEMSCIYIYKRSFWDKYNFKFEVGYNHEDMGLIPRIILKAESVYPIEIMGYNYVQQGSSVTRKNDYSKTKKRVYDTLHHFDNLYNLINNDDEVSQNTKIVFNSYLSNALIQKINLLNKTDRKIYLKELKKRKIFDLLITTTFKHKLKKLFYKLKYFRS